MPFDGVQSPCSYLEKFDHVIDLIENPKKWGKHTYINRSGQYCLIGALNAVGVGKLFEPIILKTIDEMTDREFCSIESFNDHPETLHRDVVAVLYCARRRIAAGKFQHPAVTYRATARGTRIAGEGWLDLSAVAEGIRLRPRLRGWRRDHLVPASCSRDELTRFPLNLCPRSGAAPWWFVLRIEPDHIDLQKMTAPQRDFPKRPGLRVGVWQERAGAA